MLKGSVPFRVRVQAFNKLDYLFRSEYCFPVSFERVRLGLRCPCLSALFFLLENLHDGSGGLGRGSQLLLDPFQVPVQYRPLLPQSLRLICVPLCKSANSLEFLLGGLTFLPVYSQAQHVHRRDGFYSLLLIFQEALSHLAEGVSNKLIGVFRHLGLLVCAFLEPKRKSASKKGR
ncbi:MAG TPA: hypothetical protein VFB38_24530 [Chthonomonadaceae bacterium]|nr:hypothetical protein [Chthonomonadaceae bacterium]